MILLSLLLPAAVLHAQSPPNQSVVGRPFRVSAAVTTYCAELAGLAMCEAFKPQITEFFAEKREADWARAVEPLIARSLLVRGKSWAVIRSLECRRTLCALEYAVFTDDLDREADGSEELARQVEPTGGVMAPELPGSDGRAKIVSVLIFRKRS